ncbi:hypothetical protein BCON_0014g00650 [Botryotinia convoluta]|uniref:Uncharacterized protein n=1 Tax=Botryotinia convoluta TaxID=54673 RepID=A0A4Z1IPC9_9HELO|nr:hypothetical protein BCON_0014g00650 [Botryotinia convoluta]
MEFTTAHKVRWENMQRWELPVNLTPKSACYQYQDWVDKVRVAAAMKRELAISFPKGVPPLRAYFHPVFFKREPGPPRMGDMISHADSGYYQPTSQASGSRYPDNPTSYDQGSTSAYGADHYGQPLYQPSGSGNISYRSDQPSVYATSGTDGYQPSGYNQYTSQSGGSGYPEFAADGQQYDHGNERADVPYGDVNTSEPKIINFEPQHQERTPAPRDSTASGSRSSRKAKERSRR